jgi:hypothetical protein
MASPLNAEPHGQFWFDDSRSPDVQALAAAEDQFFTVLPEAMSGSGLRRWEFFRFSRDAANARPAAILAARPYEPVVCASPNENDEIAKLFKRPQAAAKRARESGCADRQAASRSEYDKSIGDQVRRTRTDFDKAPPARGDCTALFDLMYRLGNERPGSAPSIAVIVSDGIESCVAARNARIPAPTNATRVLMVVVPPLAGAPRMTPWQSLDMQRANWKQIAPWLEVISTPSLNAEVLVNSR